MILLDTHVWIWLVDGNPRLTTEQQNYLHQHESQGLAVSVISCWEVAKLVEVGRLAFSCPVQEWIDQALDYPGIQLLELTPRIAVESTQLPGTFHRDPADQIIVATARVLSLPLFSFDEKIDNYPHVNHVSV
ncbi:MAG: type II toxin-antitoxin system VapC family toxin [Caldilineaceae bacterium]